MSHGIYTLNVPHICGEMIEVQVEWWYSGGTYYNPPDGDTTWNHPDQCPKCGISLNHDDLFQQTIERMDNEVTDRGEYVPGDEQDYDPPDYGDEMPF